MKAETFLKYSIKECIRGKGTEEAINFDEKLCKVAEFYAQAFHQQMLKEDGLFDNCFNLSGLIYGIGELGHVEIGDKSYSPMGKIYFPFGTLDQFIGDCQRFGIELTWKEEVIKNYFS